MLPPFHGERMRAYEDVIAEVTHNAIAGWREGEEFALHPTMQAITLEVILRAVFGVEEGKRHDELSEGLTEILAATGSPRAIGLLVSRPPRLAALPPPARADRRASTSSWPRRSPSGAPTPGSTSATTSSRC